MTDEVHPRYPGTASDPGWVEPAPRWVRGTLGGERIFDTGRALYGWEHPYYPQYYLPAADVRTDLLVASGGSAERGPFAGSLHSIVVEGREVSDAAMLVESAPDERLLDHYHFEWEALDRWFEEDEQIFVHPRNPYVRVDALRSSRPVRVELGGELLASSEATVSVFETGLPTRHYFAKHDVAWERLEPSTTTTECPYKGTTSQYWSVIGAGEEGRDLAWGYEFPTRQLLPITGMVAFLDERVDLFIDGVPQARPETKFG